MKFAIWVLVAAAGLSLTALLASELLPQAALESQLAQFLKLTDPFRSWWFRLLLAVMASSLFVCIIQRGPMLVRQAFTHNWRTSKALFIGFPGAAHWTAADGSAQAADIMRRVGLKVREKPLDGGVALSGLSGGVSRLGPLLSHLGMLLLILGGLAASTTGSSEQVAGQAGDVFTKPEWGFSLRIDDFSIVYYPIALNQWVEAPNGQRGRVVQIAGDSARVSLGADDGDDHSQWFALDRLRNDFLLNDRTPYTGNIKSYITRATVMDPGGGDRFSRTIEVNHPLRINGWRFYQSSFDVSTRAGRTRVDSLKVLCRSAQFGDTTLFVAVSGMDQAIQLADGWRLKPLGFYPDFRLNSQNQPFSASGQLRNPAARFALVSDTGDSSAVYAFRMDIGGMGHSPTPWTLQIVDLIGVKAAGGMTTILTVNREGGRWLIWWGFILATLGLVFAYMTTHRQAWALILRRDDGRDDIYLAASTAKSDINFLDTLAQAVKQVKQPH